jgi:hypothetical protein
MSGKWFANRGQIVQAIAAVVSACVALVALYFVLKSNNSLPKASAVLYVSTGVLLLLVGIWIGRRSRSASLPAPSPSSEARRDVPSDTPTPIHAASPVHINVNPTISPTISATVNQHDDGMDFAREALRRKGLLQLDSWEKKQDEILPNVGCLKPELIHITHDDEADIWVRSNLVEGEAGDFPTVVIPFCNEPQKGKKTAPVEGLKARLTFYKADGIEVFRRIDSGCWLGEAYNTTRLGVGAIIYLLAVLDGPMTLKNPRYSSARYSDDLTSAELLPQGHYELKVDLIGGDHGEFTETFWFNVVAGETTTIIRLNQRPTWHT